MSSTQMVLRDASNGMNRSNSPNRGAVDMLKARNIMQMILKKEQERKNEIVAAEVAHQASLGASRHSQPTPTAAPSSTKTLSSTTTVDILPAGRSQWIRIYTPETDTIQLEYLRLDPLLIRAPIQANNLYSKWKAGEAHRKRYRATLGLPALVDEDEETEDAKSVSKAELKPNDFQETAGVVTKRPAKLTMQQSRARPAAKAGRGQVDLAMEEFNSPDEILLMHCRHNSESTIDSSDSVDSSDCTAHVVVPLITIADIISVDDHHQEEENKVDTKEEKDIDIVELMNNAWFGC